MQRWQIIEQNLDYIFASHVYIHVSELIYKYLNFVDVVQEIITFYLHVQNL
jgi:hypothetical protein